MGKVDAVKMNQKGIEAVVKGTDDYDVSISYRGGGVSKICTCPHFVNSSTGKIVCKHIIATAIYWDEIRGYGRPSDEEVEEETMQPALISRSEIIAMFDNPLKVDLGKLRILAEVTSFSPKAHARLPNMPKMNMDGKEPININEVVNALKEMDTWERRRDYDPYFCAGEVTVAFCEVLDIVRKRISVSEVSELIQIASKCIRWYYKAYLQMIDGSEGDWIFPTVRIGNLVAEIYKKYPDKDLWVDFDKRVKGYAEGWEDNLSVVDIMEWKDARL